MSRVEFVTQIRSHKTAKIISSTLHRYDLDIVSILNGLSSITVLWVHHVLQKYREQDFLFAIEDLVDIGVGHFSTLKIRKHLDQGRAVLHKVGAILCQLVHLWQPGLQRDLLVDNLGDGLSTFLALILFGCSATLLFLFPLCVLLSGTIIGLLCLCLCSESIGSPTVSGVAVSSA